MRELDKIIGYEDIKKDLFHIIDVLNNPAKYSALGVSVPQGILLSGNPGIGKSLMAKCFMKETGRTEYIIRKDRPNGSFVNYIRTIFNTALKNAPSIILLDDMDKFSNGNAHDKDAEEYVAVQACIDAVKGKDVFILATANNLHHLPNSLLRTGRFDKIYRMHFPTNKDAIKIVAHFLSNKKVANDVNIEDIVRLCNGYTCAALETIVNEAGMYAGYKNRKIISQQDLIDACTRHLYKVSNNEPISDRLLKQRAIHEAGHVVVAEILNPTSVNFASITASPWRIGGCISRTKEEGYFESFNNIETDNMIGLAGKAAVEVILQETDLGSYNDLENVYNHVHRILTETAVYNFNFMEFGPTIYEHLDSIIATEISRYYNKTRKILLENQAFVNELVDALINKGTLTHSEIMKLRKKHIA